MSIRVVIWNEYRHERSDPAVGRIYPDGIHGAIATGLRAFGEFDVHTATLDEDADHGLSEARLAATDVLLWWGHMAHGDVRDEVAERVVRRVWAGMGLVVLHSGHFSKVFKRLMGTSCDLKWRVGDDREILWVTRPGHPLVEGITDHFMIDREEMYGEFFDVPQPDETVMISSFTGGEVFRSLCTWQRGAGRVVYFRPGHETFPTYFDANVRRVIANAARWAAPAKTAGPPAFGERKAGWLPEKA
jgi:trehalose utilization protein